ncbi:MAG: hypothetical protein ACYTF6_03255 [Planctomycetota bacterium]|jgi:hypothetical protein
MRKAIIGLVLLAVAAAAAVGCRKSAEEPGRRPAPAPKPGSGAAESTWQLEFRETTAADGNYWVLHATAGGKPVATIHAGAAASGRPPAFAGKWNDDAYFDWDYAYLELHDDYRAEYHSSSGGGQPDVPPTTRHLYGTWRQTGLRTAVVRWEEPREPSETWLTGSIFMRPSFMAIGGESDPGGPMIFFEADGHGRERLLDYIRKCAGHEEDRGNFTTLALQGGLWVYLIPSDGVTAERLESLAAKGGRVRVKVKGEFGIIRAGGTETPARSWPTAAITEIAPADSGTEESYSPVKFLDTEQLLQVWDIERCPRHPGVWRRDPGLAKLGIKQTGQIDWQKYDVVFIAAYQELWSGVFKEFRIAEVLRYPDHLLVKTKIVISENNAKGGPRLDFHAVLIPATDLPVRFEIGGRIGPGDAARPARPASKPAGGKAVNGLQLIITRLKDVYHVGEKIPIEAEFRNLSDRSMTFRFGMCPCGAFGHFTVLDEAGREIRYATAVHVRACDPSIDTRKIAIDPGKAFTTTVLVPHEGLYYEDEQSREYFTLKEGTYDVKFYYGLPESGNKDVWGGSITSNNLQIKLAAEK